MGGVLDDEDAAGIRLDEALAEFGVADAGEPWGGGDTLLVCPNLRAAHIYFRRAGREAFDRVITRLLDDPRVDQVVWSESMLEEGAAGYRVVTGDRGVLRFWRSSDGPDSATDRHGNGWSWEGDLAAVDGYLTPEGQVEFEDYPDAFERLSGALDLKHSGDLTVTARPGYEFKLPGTTVHSGGGSHGSLDALDSVVPLLVAGAPEGLRLPAHPRTVDVASLCLSVLGLGAGPDGPSDG